MTNPQKLFLQIVFLSSAVLLFSLSASAQHDYTKAQHLATKFFGAQRCGTNDSWLHGKCHGGDQNINGTDLLGGWHDCGDHVKFGSTNGFAAAIMLHSYIFFKDEYPDAYTPTDDNFDSNSGNGIADVLDEVKYYTDYVLKTLSGDRMYFQIGNAGTDHLSCSEPVYQTNSEPNLGGVRESHWVDGGGASNLAGINAAVLAMMSIAYKEHNSTYASTCLSKAKEFFAYGQKDDSYWSQHSVDGYGADDGTYKDTSWADDMALGAISLYHATNDDKYLTGGNIDGKDLDGYDFFVKETNFCGYELMRAYTTPTYASVQPLAVYSYAKLTGNDKAKTAIIHEASGDPEDSQDGGYLSSYNNTYKFAFYDGWGSLKHSASAAYVSMLAYDITKDTKYKDFAKNNLDFMLGTHPSMSADAPSGYSFLVGFGSNYPDGQVHHSAAAGLQTNGSFALWHDDSYDNKYTLWGALVGGPTEADGGYYNDRDDPSWGTSVQVKSNEVCIYYNAPLVALFGAMDGAAASPNVAPTYLTLSKTKISSGQPSGTTLGILTTGDPNFQDTHTYSIVTGGDNFSIDGDKIVTAKELTAGTLNIKVKTTDGGGLSYEKEFSITVAKGGSEDNLLYDLGWYAYTNGYGSKVNGDTVASDIIKDGVVKVDFEIIKEDAGNDVYPGATISADTLRVTDEGFFSYKDGKITNFTNIDFFVLEYKSNNNFKLLLPLAGTGYNDYYLDLPNTNDALTVDTIYLNNTEFQQEEGWGTIVDFDKSKMYNFTISTDFNDANAYFELQTFVVDGVKPDIENPITSMNFNNLSDKITIKSISSSKMNISVPDNSKYSISIYSVNGKLIKKIEPRLKKGNNIINWNASDFSNQMAVIKISGNKKKFTGRLLLK